MVHSLYTVDILKKDYNKYYSVPNIGNCISFYKPFLTCINATIKEICFIFPNIFCISSIVADFVVGFGLHYFKDNCGWSSISSIKWTIPNYVLYSNRFHSGNDYPSTRFYILILTSSLIPII